MAKQVQADPTLRRVPIIAIAYAAEDRGVAILRAGCRAWGQKPLYMSEFPMVVRAIIAG